MPMAGTRRITIETLAAGQPRPYADHHLHVRVTFEVVPWMGEAAKKGEFAPNDKLSEETVRRDLLGLACGFTEFRFRDLPKEERTMANYFKPSLDRLEQTSPGVWEFHVTDPYTG